MADGRPPEGALAFWQRDYPAMQTLAGLLKTVQEAGYRCLWHTRCRKGPGTTIWIPSSAIWRATVPSWG